MIHFFSEKPLVNSTLSNTFTLHRNIQVRCVVEKAFKGLKKHEEIAKKEQALFGESF